MSDLSSGSSRALLLFVLATAALSLTPSLHTIQNEALPVAALEDERVPYISLILIGLHAYQEVKSLRPVKSEGQQAHTNHSHVLELQLDWNTETVGRKGEQECMLVIQKRLVYSNSKRGTVQLTKAQKARWGQQREMLSGVPQASDCLQFYNGFSQADIFCHIAIKPCRGVKVSRGFKIAE